MERRLDNVIYRMGLGESRRDARQVVLHGHVTVNGKKVNIPSFIVKAGDVVAIKESSRDEGKFKTLVENLQTNLIPKWLELNKEALSAKVVTLPAREDIDFPFEEQLIVELYSK